MYTSFIYVWVVVYVCVAWVKELTMHQNAIVTNVNERTLQNIRTSFVMYMYKNTYETGQTSIQSVQSRPLLMFFF